MRVLLLIVASLFATPAVMAQNEPEYRIEVGAGLGGVAYSGDFSGGQIASVNSRSIFTMLQERFCASYCVCPAFAARTPSE